MGWSLVRNPSQCIVHVFIIWFENSFALSFWLCMFTNFANLFYDFRAIFVHFTVNGIYNNYSICILA